MKLATNSNNNKKNAFLLNNVSISAENSQPIYTRKKKEEVFQSRG